MAAGAEINNDELWLDLGKSFAGLKARCRHVSHDIIYKSYPKAHRLAGLAYSLVAVDIRDLASMLDNIICSSYPLTVRTISSDEIRITLTGVFYKYPIEPIEIANNTYPTRPYQNALYENDKLYIEDFIRDIGLFITQITNMPIVMNSVYYRSLRQIITKMTKRLEKIGEMIRDADII